MRYTQKKFRVSSVYWPRREFDPASSQDLSEYKNFLKTSNWENGCPFITEWPYLSVIACIENKIIQHHIDKLIKQAK